MKPRLFVPFLLLFVVLPAAGVPARAATLTVISTADSGAGSLRAAITSAASGDTIQFGFASGTITLTSGALTVDKNLTIQGLGADKLTVSGNNASRVFDVTAGTVTLSGMKITAGYVSGYYSAGANGAGLKVAAGAAVTVDACWFLSNSANYAGEYDPCGGGIYNQGTLTVTVCTFSGNSACGGSAVANDGTAAFTNCTFSGNSAQFGGALLNFSGTTTLLNCTVAGNTIVANDNGGGLNLYNGSVVFKNTIGALNSAAVGNARIDLDDNWGGTGTFQSQGYNLVGDLGQYVFSGNTTGDRYGDPSSTTTPSAGAFESGTAIDPLLDALDTGLAQGGTTPIRPLQSGSPAINNGTASGAPATDQRGYSRSGNTDIGAFEFGGSLLNPTTTTLTSSPNPSTAGQLVTLTATVTSSGGTPTGTVTFFDGATSLGTGTLNGSGVATLTTSALAVGLHSLTATYNGATGFNSSTSAVHSHNVNPVATTTVVTATPNPSLFGQSVTFTATVSAGAGPPTGTVQFGVDGSNLGGPVTLSGGMASTVTAALAVGGHAVTAQYLPDTPVYAGSSGSLAGGHTVNKATTATSLGSSPNPSRVGQTVTFTATVTVNAPGAGTPSGTVTFLEGATTLGTGTLSGGTATFSTAALGVGPHTVTARYDGDASFDTSTSTPLTQTVQKADTTTGLNTTPNPSRFGQSVTFTATVTVNAPGSGVPTGTVTFLEGAVTLGTGTLTGGTATLTTAGLGVGPHSVTARYEGDTGFNTSTSSPLTQTVQKADTTTGLTSAPNPSRFGQAVTFTATVAVSAPGAGTPTGTVTFLEGAATLGTGTLSGNTATFTTATLSVATHAVTARYEGDASFNTSTSAAASQEVQKADTTTTLTSAPNPSIFGQGVTFTATVAVSAPGAGTPTGTVTFLEGATTLGTGTLAGNTATFTTNTLSVAAHNVTARYEGDASFNPSTSAPVSQTVQKADTTTALTSSANPSRFGQPVTFTATVAAVAPGAGTPTGTVTFLDGAATLGTGTLSGGTAVFTTTALGVGAHPVTARYDGDASFNAGTSAVLNQDVQKADSATAVASSANPSAWGQSVTFTATVTAAAPGAGTPTGAVTFHDGAATLGTGTLDGSGVATFSTGALDVATHPITASYGGDGNFNAGASAALSQVVNPAGTATALALSASPVCQGEAVTFTATVTVTAPGAGTPTGTVTFYDDATPFGTGTLDGSGVATLTTSAMAPGARSVSAAYGGDAHVAASTSPGLPHTVNPLPTPVIVGPTTVCLGSSATLDAGANYASYRWSPGGETTRAITVSPATATAYTVAVTTAAGCAATSPAHTVTVLRVTEITAMPQSRTIWTGQSTVLTVQATGETVHYQWYLGTPGDVSEPVGEDASSFTTPALAETTPYWVQVTGGCGPADSATAWVTVRQVASHAVVDFDGNGISDVFWRNEAQDVTSAWLLGDGGLISGLYLGGSGSGAWEVKGVNDFTGDGPDDILWRNLYSGDLSLWFLGKGGMLTEESPGTVDPAWQVVGTGDVDADGMADLFWRNDDLGLLSLWFMDGASVTGSLDLGTVDSTDWQVIGTADVDGSGTADLVWRYGPTGIVSVWFLNERGYADSVSPGVLDPAWRVVGFGDVDRDGCADVLWRNGTTGALSLWLVNAGGLKQSIALGTVADLTWRVTGVGDFNGDGRADLLWRNAATGTLAFWFLHEKGIVGTPSPGVVPLEWQTLNHVILNVFPTGGGKDVEPETGEPPAAADPPLPQ